MWNCYALWWRNHKELSPHTPNTLVSQWVHVQSKIHLQLRVDAWCLLNIHVRSDKVLQRNFLCEIKPNLHQSRRKELWTTFQTIITVFFNEKNNKTTTTDLWKPFALLELPTVDKFKMLLLVHVSDISVVVHPCVKRPLSNKTPCTSRWLNADCTE